jgi:type II restriction enzyme
MGLIDRVGQPTFTLNDLYQLESDVRSTYPENRHVRAKIRQQLQVLRDKGYLEFTGRGTYSLTN